MHAIADLNLTTYQVFILNKIIGQLADTECNIYELVQCAISDKHILASNNATVLETCFAIKEFLLRHNFAVEEKEMTSYKLTKCGMKLRAKGSLDAFRNEHVNKNKNSFLSCLFAWKRKK